MTTTPEVIDLHAVAHPFDRVRQVGFPLDHPYLEQCWAPIVGPSSILLLRHCAALWREAVPAQASTEDLARQLGLGRGTGPHGPLWHTIERVVQFRFASLSTPGDLDVYTQVPPVQTYRLNRLPAWSRSQHDRLLGQHLDSLVRSAGQAPTRIESPTQIAEHALNHDEPPAHVRMAQHLERISNHPAAAAPSLSR